MADYELSFDSVSIPTDSGGATVTVEEDSDTDSTTETSETITLSDGTTSYSTTSDSFAGSGQVALSFDLGPPSDVTVTADGLLPVDVTLVNTSPDAPTSPSPSDGATDVPTTTDLSVDVTDPDGDSMDVSFYWDDDTLIETVSGVASGDTATTSSLDLNYDTTKNWYAVADDGSATTTSTTWSFTTEKEPTTLDLVRDYEITGTFVSEQSFSKTFAPNINIDAVFQEDYTITS